jgi:hypothetical protein
MPKEKLSPDDALNTSLRWLQEFGGKPLTQAEKNRALADNIQRQDLGQYSDADSLPDYALNGATRDPLVAHARQDAAHALLNTITLMNDIGSLRSLVAKLVLLSAIQIILLGLIIWRLW